MPNDVDLSSCDREPIHIPGRIQPHGCLLACDAQAVRITRTSQNAGAILGRETPRVDERLADYFNEADAHTLRNALAQASDPRRPALIFGWRDSATGRCFDVSLHQHDGMSIIEFEPAAADEADNPLRLTRQIIARTKELKSLDEMAARVPRYLQAMLGYHRVMMYRFAVDGSGKVIGEAKRSDLESFLGQHFPASDIPQQARQLYLKNAIRVITDSSGAGSLIVPERDASGAALDLSFAHLRSVSPIHLEYLRNMGVKASMSLSIIIDGALWGLIACHHYEPRTVPMAQRVAAEMFADFFSLHFTATHHQRRFQTSLRTRKTLDGLTSKMSFDASVDDFLRDNLEQIARLIPSDGVGLWINGVWTSHGLAPPQTALPAIVHFLADRDSGEIIATHALSDRIAAAADYAQTAAGMLAIPLSQTGSDYLMFFRKEQVQTLDWAGDPNKTYETGPFGDRLTPRKSFAIWKEQVERQSIPWSTDDRDTAATVQVGLREVLLRQSEILSAERKKAEVRQRVLNEELNHRVKNILALIKSLVNQPVDHERSLEEFAIALRGRIMALSFAHDQVVRSDGGGVLPDLIRAELSPYPAAQITLDGPDVGLDARAYSVLALVLHELATNAAKYGALSRSSGRLKITWTIRDDGRCEIEWMESGGPPVRPPTRQGFGTVLLSRSIPFDLSGSSEVDYRPGGVVAKLCIPSQFVAAMPQRQASPPGSDRPAATDQLNIASATILLVEDQLVIALDAEDMLGAMGAKSVISVASADEALLTIARTPPTLAILDVNLGAGSSLPIADELTRLGIPFIFATGYGDTAMIPGRLRDLPIVRKPYSIESLRAALAVVLNGGG
ncbi:hybrid sensor histidine kinase/response regulator [Rhodopseudomonas palustris]|uniref:histidine kinase n=1 Tax=Rhodopseudomonas palustris TaxID=1076 RepID=A0A323UAE6_RHOPL|nr:HWE histidine kinase domain-containing protein [Rhodopseudomonas palustris]PZA09792.1 hybrid sensor histidine kinase/response regulator [Rhodopseudomonas palustris]